MTFPTGARPISDPEGEVERLAAARRAAEHVTITRRDLDVLLAAASALLHADAAAILDFQLSLPGDFTYTDVKDVVRRLGPP